VNHFWTSLNVSLGIDLDNSDHEKPYFLQSAMGAKGSSWNSALGSPAAPANDLDSVDARWVASAPEDEEGVDAADDEAERGAADIDFSDSEYDTWSPDDTHGSKIVARVGSV
jgi:hypothetical protein